VSEIHGDLLPAQREISRKLFQDDQHRVCLAITKAGGVGLDLHDVTGRHPRKAYHLPGFSALDFIQATGRPVRAGAKSPVQQEAVLLDHDRDRKVYSNLCRRLSNIEALTDADLESEWMTHAKGDWMGPVVEEDLARIA
jgi:superfamily II DNA/RNA helicase